MFVLGGFNHRDLPNEAPVTLKSCEKLSIIDNTWHEISPMGRERAFAASVVLDNQFIYLLGGMNDFTILPSIEKYDTLADTWETVFFELP